MHYGQRPIKGITSPPGLFCCTDFFTNGVPNERWAGPSRAAVAAVSEAAVVAVALVIGE